MKFFLDILMRLKIHSKLLTFIYCLKLRVYLLNQLKPFLILVVVASPSFSQTQTDIRWTTETLENSVIARTNGEITFGDLLQIKFTKGSCDFGNMFFSIYTISEQKFITDLEGKILPITYNGVETKVKVLASFPFLSGHIVYLDLGLYPLDDTLLHLSRKDVIEIEIINKNGFVAEEVFDIPSNRWTTNGALNAVRYASLICSSL